MTPIQSTLDSFDSFLFGDLKPLPTGDVLRAMQRLRESMYLPYRAMCSYDLL